MYILNLAFADLIMACVAVPITPWYTFSGDWIFGRVLCNIFAASQGVSVYMSTFTLTCIALDRYYTIFHKHGTSQSSATMTALVVTSVDIAAILFVLPYSLSMRVYGTEDGITVCEEEWTVPEHRVYFGIFTNIIQFVLPFFVIILCYIKIGIKMKGRESSNINSCRSESSKAALAEKNKKLHMMLISMVVIFGICWFPINFINVVHDIFSIECWSLYYFTFFMCHLVAMSSVCYNPIIYVWTNSEFRNF